MSNTKNTAKVTLSFSKDGEHLDWGFNEAAQERFGKGEGLRHNIGCGYFLANKDERDALVTFFGKGAVRRGLMVLARGRHTNESDAQKATALAESLRSTKAAAAA
jgi:hypothetical protein